MRYLRVLSSQRGIGPGRCQSRGEGSASAAPWNKSLMSLSCCQRASTSLFFFFRILYFSLLVVFLLFTWAGVIFPISTILSLSPVSPFSSYFEYTEFPTDVSQRLAVSSGVWAEVVQLGCTRNRPCLSVPPEPGPFKQRKDSWQAEQGHGMF